MGFSATLRDISTSVVTEKSEAQKNKRDEAEQFFIEKNISSLLIQPSPEQHDGDLLSS